MYWWYWSYPWYPYIPPYFIDPAYLMMWTLQWMIYPYYYAMMIEAYRTVIETWRKTVESLTKALEIRAETKSSA